MQYNFNLIEEKWRKFWKEKKTFQKEDDYNKPKFYVLDMFAYPSGAGLHVGHPLGYIATDIVARYKKLNGFNVLHPMGFDAFGLPTEQYAIQTGIHPEEITKKNTDRYLEQLDRMGLVYDSKTHFRTSDPEYYRWTQWIFIKLYNSWFDNTKNKARPIHELISIFEFEGNKNINACSHENILFDADDWKGYSLKSKNDIINKFRLMYLSESLVNWCPALNTVLANDEVVNGVSERGGHKIERKKMKQWSMRMKAYADRLLDGLERLDWSESIKEIQKNWIGRSKGMQVSFKITNNIIEKIDVFTTRPETIYGTTFLVLAPEHKYVETIRNKNIDAYLKYVESRSDLERISDVKKITGIFSNQYAEHPITGKKIPIWISEYVLNHYGTGAIMAVPAHDSRDFAFATYFNIPKIEVIKSNSSKYPEEAFEGKDGFMCNSSILNDLNIKEANEKAIDTLISLNAGKNIVKYKLRDPNFSRQRYWGEPIPIVYDDEGVSFALNESELPIQLPKLKDISSTTIGASPLIKAKKWIKYSDEFTRENHTMPGYAGSSWYFFRYIDPYNEDAIVSPKLEKYWMNIDLYIGGAEHAVGHLLYSRFWTKVLHDLGYISVDEPFKKLVNQGMIQGRSSLIYRIKNTNQYVSHGLKHKYETDELHIYVGLVQNDILNITELRKWRKDFVDAEFILENGKYICGARVEKMSKRWYNVINPDDICNKYGADTFRCYEMFLGPLTESKPFTLDGIIGVHKFLRKVFNLFIDLNGNNKLTTEQLLDDELKILHQTIKKVKEGIENLSFNTAIAQMMIFVNEITKRKSYKKELLEPFLIILSPFAPHLCEELWEKTGNSPSIFNEHWIEYDENILKENFFNYPIQVNGKVRTILSFPIEAKKEEVEKKVLSDQTILKYTTDQEIKRFIFIKEKIINIVIK